MKDWVRDLATRRFPKGAYSQAGQDGILEEIFRHVPPATSPPTCVEFGFNADSMAGGSGANTARLILEKGWQATLFDDSRENPAINLRRERLTASTVVNTFERVGVPRTPDYISIDVDSTDLWIFRALLPHYRASVYSVEYNSHFPLEAAITFPDDPAERWEEDRGYGASLGALVDVANEQGYSLVAVEPGLDAFFVRDDLLDDGSGLIAWPLSRWRSMTSLYHHESLRNPQRSGIFLDYRVWHTTGDPIAARDAAVKTCQTCLAGHTAPSGMLQRTMAWVTGRPIVTRTKRDSHGPR